MDDTVAKYKAIWLRATIIALALAVATATGAIGQQVNGNYEREFGEALDLGTKALALRNYSSAEQYFRKTLAIADWLGDDSRLGRSHFYLGRTSQERAASVDDTVTRGRFLEMAIESYRQALLYAPNSAAVHNNLGRSYEQLGRMVRARMMYARAVSIGGANQDLYLSNYAALLTRKGVDPEAAKVLRELAERRPEDAQTHRQLSEYYIQAGSKDLVPYLWDLLADGHVIRAEETGVRALIEGKLPASVKEEMLTIVAAALARQDYVPSELTRIATRSALEALTSDPDVGPGARELLVLHDSPNLTAGSDWWASRGRADADPPRGVWPRDAFRDVIRGLGHWYGQREQFSVAEEYYRLAARFVPEELDPVAVRDLARAYLRQGDLNRLEELVVEYEPALFAGKGAAYRERQLQRIYEFHRTLGEIYGHLGQWGDGGTVNSAIFQLESARAKAVELEDAATGDSTTTAYRGELRFGPELADLLARGYLATGDSTASRRTRFEAAERYQVLGAEPAAVRVIEPMQPGRLRDQDLKRYDKLKLKMPVAKVTPKADP